MYTMQNMPEYKLCLTRIFPYKHRIVLSLYGNIQVGENPYSGIFYLVLASFFVIIRINYKTRFFMYIE